MKGPLPVDLVDAMAQPHLRRLEALGVTVMVTSDLSHHPRIVALDHQLLAQRPQSKREPMILNPAFDPRWWPNASPADSFIVLCHDEHGRDVATACARVLPVGLSLPADIVTGRLFYGRATDDCRFRWVSRLQLPEIAACNIGLAGGVWVHPRGPGHQPGAPNAMLGPMWRLLLTSMLAVEWTWLVGVQALWNLTRHGWDPQQFGAAVRGLTWGDDPERLTLSIMHATEAIDAAGAA